MQEWAFELQRFFTSGACNKEALRLAVEECDDPEIKAYLSDLPQNSQEAFKTGQHLIAVLTDRNLMVEAAVLELVVYLPKLAVTKNANLLNQEERAGFAELFRVLIESCRTTPLLSPSLAFVSSLKGAFDHSLRNLSAACNSYEEARDILRKLTETNPYAHQSDLAGTLNSLGLLYNEMKQFIASRDVLREASHIRRKLAKADPQTYQLDLAITLTSLGHLYVGTRDFSAARKPLEEARSIFSKLTNVDPQTYKHELATALTCIGSLYRNTGELGASREVLEEARSIRRELAEADPLIYQHELAVTLISLGNLYNSAGEFAAARDALEEARKIHSMLTNADPKIYQHCLASTLNYLGNLYWSMEDFTSALETYEEAREIYSKLAEAIPQIYQYDLANTVNNLGNIYRLKNDFAAALEAYEEAREIYSRLAEADPQAYQYDLANILLNLGNFYSSTREFTAAREAYEGARDIYSKLVEPDHHAYQRDLANSLNNLGIICEVTKDFASARDALEAARDIFSSLARSDSQAYRPNFANTLNSLGSLYINLRDFTAAHETLEEARDIYSELVKTNPQAYRRGLANTLRNLGSLYHDSRNFMAALKAYESVLDLKRSLADADPEIYQHELADILNKLGLLYLSIRDFASACEALEEARDIYSIFADADPKTYDYDLAVVLNSLGNIYRDMGDFDAARKDLEEARNIVAKLAKTDLQIYHYDLGMVLNSLGNLYIGTKDFAAAHEALEKARDVIAKLAKSDPQSYQSDLAMTLNNLGTLYRQTRDFGAMRIAYNESAMQAEAVVHDHQRHLSKGHATAAYQFLLSESVSDSATAFAYAAAMRDGPARSNTLGQIEMNATRNLIQCIEQRIGSNVAILAPSAGHDDTIALGLITASNCDWWHIPSKEWLHLIVEDAKTADHRVRCQLARRIWCELPQGLQMALAPVSPESPEILISGDPLWSAFPWELLRFGEGTGDYLGLHKALPRIGSILAPALERDLAATQLGKNRRVAIVAPHTTGSTPLLGVESEIESLMSRLPQIGGELVEEEIIGSVAHEGLMRRAIDAVPDVLWYSGHGAIVDNQEVLILHAETPRGNRPQDQIVHFGAYQLGELADEKGFDVLFDHAPLVVLNSCMTGLTREHGGEREDMVKAFLRHGAGAVIATALPIFDSVGEALGRAMFSEDSIVKQTIGKSVVEVRRQLAAGICSDIDKPTWGAWGAVHLHGNAFASSPFHNPGGNKDEYRRG